MLSRRFAIIAAAVALLGGSGAVAYFSGMTASQPVAQNTETQNSAPQQTESSPLAQPRDRNWREGFLRDMNLTPEQQEQLKALRSQHKDEIQQTHEALHQAHEEMHDLMASDAAEATIRAKYREISNLRQKMSDLRFNSMMEMRQIFTSEQRRLFAEKMKERKSRFSNRRDRGGFKHHGQRKGPPGDGF